MGCLVVWGFHFVLIDQHLGPGSVWSPPQTVYVRVEGKVLFHSTLGKNAKYISLFLSSLKLEQSVTSTGTLNTKWMHQGRIKVWN